MTTSTATATTASTPAPSTDPTSALLPSADLLPHAEPETDLWFDQRRGGITATDVPKILGLSRYGNALHVWLDKRGDLPDEGAGEAARWGTLLEPVIAEEYAARTGAAITAVGVAAHRRHPWRRCSLDRVAHHPLDGIGAVEVKNRNAFVAGRWRDDVPDDVLAQVMWQLEVTGLPWIDVAVLLGGNHLTVHRVEPDPVVQSFIRSETDRVWEAVHDGVPPHVDPDAALLALLDRMYPDRAGSRRLEGVDLALARERVTELLAAKDDVKAAEERETAARAGVVQLLDDSDEATDEDGQWLFRYRETTRKGYSVQPATFRQLTINRKA